MLAKTHDHILAANDHRHATRTRDSDHFIQSVAVFADIKLNVLDSLSRKELLRLVTVGSSREAVNLDLLHSRLLLRFMLLVCRPAYRLLTQAAGSGAGHFGDRGSARRSAG
jgi:hypothetical protein